MPLTQRPDLSKRAFARTNSQTIEQRAAILRELVPDITSVAEICCGDCARQWIMYKRMLGVTVFRGLDIEPEIVSANRTRGIDCVPGDALDAAVMAQFLPFDVVFFGPPLSVACDGHSALPFRSVVPSFSAFTQLFLGQMGYDGLLVCITPKTAHMGDIHRLYAHIKTQRPDMGLHLIHTSYAARTGHDELTATRLKYVELWLSSKLDDAWTIRQSRPTTETG